MTQAARDAAHDSLATAPTGIDGVVRGQPVVDRLVALLDLERIEENIFRGVSPTETPTRVFGGQVAGQALVAAGRTVPPDRHVHSLHAYFIRPGDPRVPIVYEVDRTRDGRSFTTRRVLAVQHGKTIFSLSASFQIAEDGLDHTNTIPDVPAPEDLDDLQTWVHRAGPAAGFFAVMPRPFDMRYVDPPTWSQAEPVARDGHRVWLRADGSLPDDPLVHVCVLAYVSDLTLLGAVPGRHGRGFGDGVIAASLDHAMWFHRPVRADDWVLYDCDSPSASGGRGLATGRFYSRDGSLVASVVQEGLVRLRD